MISKELKRLSRRELVDIIYQLKKNEQELQEEIEALKKELDDKRIRISQAGSIADAAMSVTNIFSIAQETADLYLREIENMKEDVAKECAEKVEIAKVMAESLLADAKNKIATQNTPCENEQEFSVTNQTDNPEMCEDIING